MSPVFTLDWRVQKPAIVVAAIVCGGLAWLHRGDVLAWVGFAFLFLPVVLVCLIATGLWLTFDRSRTTPGSARLARAGLIIAGGAVGSIVPGWIIGGVDLRRAQDWAERLAPKIEQYHAQHDVYPASLSEITSLADAPRLVNGDLSYFHHPGEFGFHFTTGFWSGVHWSSASRRWTDDGQGSHD